MCSGINGCGYRRNCNFGCDTWCRIGDCCRPSRCTCTPCSDFAQRDSSAERRPQEDADANAKI